MVDKLMGGKPQAGTTQSNTSDLQAQQREQEAKLRNGAFQAHASFQDSGFQDIVIVDQSLVPKLDQTKGIPLSGIFSFESQSTLQDSCMTVGKETVLCINNPDKTSLLGEDVSASPFLPGGFNHPKNPLAKLPKSLSEKLMVYSSMKGLYENRHKLGTEIHHQIRAHIARRLMGVRKAIVNLAKKANFNVPLAFDFKDSSVGGINEFLKGGSFVRIAVPDENPLVKQDLGTNIFSMITQDPLFVPETHVKGGIVYLDKPQTFASGQIQILEGYIMKCFEDDGEVSEELWQLELSAARDDVVGELRSIQNGIRSEYKVDLTSLKKIEDVTLFAKEVLKLYGKIKRATLLSNLKSQAYGTGGKAVVAGKSIDLFKEITHLEKISDEASFYRESQRVQRLAYQVALSVALDKTIEQTEKMMEQGESVVRVDSEKYSQDVNDMSGVCEVNPKACSSAMSSIMLYRFFKDSGDRRDHYRSEYGQILAQYKEARVLLDSGKLDDAIQLYNKTFKDPKNKILMEELGEDLEFTSDVRFATSIGLIIGAGALAMATGGAAAPLLAKAGLSGVSLAGAKLAIDGAVFMGLMRGGDAIMWNEHFLIDPNKSGLQNVGSLGFEYIMTVAMFGFFRGFGKLFEVGSGTSMKNLMQAFRQLPKAEKMARLMKGIDMTLFKTGELAFKYAGFTIWDNIHFIAQDFFHELLGDEAPVMQTHGERIKFFICLEFGSFLAGPFIAPLQSKVAELVYKRIIPEIKAFNAELKGYQKILAEYAEGKEGVKIDDVLQKGRELVDRREKILGKMKKYGAPVSDADIAELQGQRKKSDLLEAMANESYVAEAKDHLIDVLKAGQKSGFIESFKEGIDGTFEVSYRTKDGPQVGKISPRDAKPLNFKEGLGRYNEKLKAFDEADGAKRGRKELTVDQEAVLADEGLQTLARERMEYVSSRFAEHEVASAANPESPMAKHLEAHTGAVDLGSHVEFGKGHVFESPAKLIDFAEGLLTQAYKGEIQSGAEVTIPVETARGPVEARVRFVPKGEIHDGVAEGPSAPGGRVSLRIEFEQSIGREGVVKLTSDTPSIEVVRKSGGREENVTVVNGEKAPTNTLYVIGGAYGPTGKFGLYTVFSGKNAPPMNDAEFWGKHAFVTGDAKSFEVVDGKATVLKGSKLAKMAEGEAPKVGLGSKASVVDSAKVDAPKAKAAPKKKNGPDFSKWSARVLSDAKASGDAGLIAQAEALQRRVAEGVEKPAELKKELGALGRAAQSFKARTRAEAQAVVDASTSFTDVNRQHVKILQDHRIIDEVMAGKIEGFLEIPGARERVEQTLKSSAGLVKKDPIAAINSIKGMYFELSRIADMGRRVGGIPETVKMSDPVEVKYVGFDKAGQLKPMKSPIQNDVPIIKGHVWETKRYPRLAAGETRGGKNQLLKYQAALEAGHFNGVTIELSGNVDPDYIILAEKRAPDVEILYTLELPGGYEIAFPIKEARSDRLSLRRIEPPVDNAKLLPERTQRILKGVQKGIEAGKIWEIFMKGILKPEDVKDSPMANKLLEAELDPAKIHDVEVFREHERLVHEKRLRMIEGFVGFKPTHRDNRIFFEPITNEVIDREIRISERNIAEESSEAVRKQYTVESHLKGAVREEFTARLRKIAEVETERACHENPSVDAGRRSKGYRGPTEGYPLDTNHIYMDVVKAVSRRDRASSRKKSGKGKKGAVDAKRHPVMDIGGGRSYEVSHHFPTADQVAAEMRDGKHQEMTTKITVRFPAGAEDNIPVSREYDVTGGKLRQKIDLDILEKNVKLLGALRIDSTVPDSIKRGLQMREGEIEVVHTRLLDLRVDRKEAIDAAGRTEKRSVAQSFEKPIRDAQQAILDTYEKVLGPKQYRELTIQVVEEKSDNIRKFIYAIDAKGSVRLCEESLEPGSERPAHSQLVDGQNVYGAGEIYVRGLDVISINNGSGHYRPDAKENILYVKSLLEGAGFTADGARLEHIKFPFVTIDMPIEELWHNNFFNGK